MIRMPRAMRPLKTEYMAVAKLLEDDLYLDMTEGEFVATFIKETGGSGSVERAKKIYANLMEDAGLEKLNDIND